MSIRHVVLALGILGASLPLSAVAQDQVVANVNGKPVTEADLAWAATEFGAGLEQLAAPERLRALLELVVEHQLFADAAEKEALNTAKAFQHRLTFARRKLLRDEYVLRRIAPQVTEADAKRLYDEQRAAQKQDEVRLLHLLVETEAEARDLKGKLVAGTDFRRLAQQFSKDAGSNWNGGDLGYVGKGQMSEEVEALAFSLTKGVLSEPLKTKFGWHLLLVEDRRPRVFPEFEAVKTDLVNHLVQRKGQEALADLISRTKIELVDPELKKTVPATPLASAAKVAPAAKSKAAPTSAPQNKEWTKGLYGQ